MQRLTEAMLTTRLWANATERDLATIPPRVLPPRSFVVALTPLLDDRFISALFLLAGRGHDVAVVECALAGTDGDEGRETETSRLAARLWQAERDVVRDRLADSRISVAAWHEEEHLDLVLGQLTRQRRRALRLGRP